MTSGPRDILICGYKYSGIDWLEKILNSLTNQTTGAKRPDLNITGCANKLPASFPENWFSFHTKILLILRNPKDVAAASYSTNMGYNEDVFSAFLEDFVSSGSQSLSAITWFDHTLQWGEFLKNLPAGMVHIVYFENLVNDLREELNKISTFLNLQCEASRLDGCFKSMHIDEIIQSDGPFRKRRKTDDHNQASVRALTCEPSSETKPTL